MCVSVLIIARSARSVLGIISVVSSITVHVPDAPRPAVAAEISHLRGRIKTLEARSASSFLSSSERVGSATSEINVRAN